MARIEALLSARLFLTPQVVRDRLYFISNLSGHLSLYAMDVGGSVPEPLLPPHIALQNPHLMDGLSFTVFPSLGTILVMIDSDGDELYQPMLIPVDGGFPEPALDTRFEGSSVHLIECDIERGTAYLLMESRTESIHTAFRVELPTGNVVRLAESAYGCYPVGHSESHVKTLFIDAYGAGDHVLYIEEDDRTAPRVLFGVPLEKRTSGGPVQPNSISDCHFVRGDAGIIFFTSLFSDTYGPGYMELSDPSHPVPLDVNGLLHRGQGEFTGLYHLADNRYMLTYNIDGCSWFYECRFDEGSLSMQATRVLVGEGELSGGVVESCRYDRESGRYALSFSTATSPTQIYLLDSDGSGSAGGGRDTDGSARAGESRIHGQTRERVLGMADDMLAGGEDASFTSYDGLRISARLYRPAPSLGFEGRRPLVYYVHGGPQSQERPDFAWFSMPLIQFLTLRGFAVFVPNVRGSTGYGHQYMKQVMRDWGGKDRLDHVHAMTEVLPLDQRIDTARSGVVGRSYGGYMTLTLATRHPDLWSAACDMFGPYDLIGFASRVPETWKPFMTFLMGDPDADREMLTERSPKTYMDDLKCPLLVIQGKNDPRVVEVESRELVEKLRDGGKSVEYLMFEDEGHDVLKFDNRVRCYNAIADFFITHLKP